MSTHLVALGLSTSQLILDYRDGTNSTTTIRRGGGGEMYAKGHGASTPANSIDDSQEHTNGQRTHRNGASDR